MIAAGSRQRRITTDESATSTSRLMTLLKPRSGTSLMPMMRQPVEILETGAQRDELQQVRNDVHVEALAAGEFHDAEHLEVFVERQRDVDVVDALAAADVRRIGDGAEHRQAAIADGVGRRRGSSTKPMSLKPSSPWSRMRSATMRPRSPDADDQHVLQADAGPPAPAQQIAHDLARRVSERDGEAQEEQPDGARDRDGTPRRVASTPWRTAKSATPASTARMLPTRTAKKSSTRVRPRRSRYSP